jgi:hypothetical protein
MVDIADALSFLPRDRVLEEPEIEQIHVPIRPKVKTRTARLRTLARSIQTGREGRIVRNIDCAASVAIPENAERRPVAGRKRE